MSIKLFVLFVLYLKPQDATIRGLFYTLFLKLSNISEADDSVGQESCVIFKLCY